MVIGYLRYKELLLKAISIIFVGILFTACQSGSKKTSATKENTALSLNKESFTTSVPKYNLREWIKQKRRHITLRQPGRILLH